MIVIPTYNEKANIEPLVRKIRETIGEIPILFVDDSSPDGTAEEISRVAELFPGVFLLNRQKKEGLGPAYRHAFKHILEKESADYIITMDADFSHEPEMIPLMIRELRDVPVVVGSRYIQGGQVKNWNRVRKFVSKAGNIYAKALIGLPVHDLTSGFVGYRTNALKTIDFDAMEHDGYAFQIEIKYLLNSHRHLIKEIPITFVERREGKSKFSVEIVSEAVVYPMKIFFKRNF